MISWILSIFLLVASQCGAIGPTQFIEQVEQCLTRDQAIIPKESTLALLHKAAEEKFVEELGDDSLRLKFVALQGCVEKQLAQMQGSIVGIIHTPLPPTPLCTLPEPVDTTLLALPLRDDPGALFTLRSRAAALRGYLSAGHTLYCTYPKVGLGGRSAQQQGVYLAEVARYPGVLVDQPLNIAALDPNMVGATYFIRFDEDALWVFSIQSTQANAPREQARWAIWLGPFDHPDVRLRVDALLKYLTSLGLRLDASVKPWQNDL